MARPDTWMPFYGDDYQADTAHCSAIERGAYSDLLWACWKRKNALPKNDVQLMRLARCTPDEWKQAKDTVMAFFTDNGDSYSHKRVGEELAIATERYQRKVAAGKAGGRASGQARTKHPLSNRSTTVQADVGEYPTQLQPHSPKGEIYEAKASYRPKRGTSLPTDWQPNERNTSDAAARGYNQSQIRELAEHFRDHHTAKGTTSKDWDASWRTWLANDKRFTRNTSGKPGINRPMPGSVVDVVARLKARADLGGQGERGGVGRGGNGVQAPGVDFGDTPEGACGGGRVIDADDAERMYRASRGAAFTCAPGEHERADDGGADNALPAETSRLPR